MTKDALLQFIKDNPLGFVATVEGDQPRVRVFMTVSVDDKGILYNTGTPKDTYRQLTANPKLEICYYSVKTNEMVRVTGRAEFDNSPEVKARVLEVFDFLKPVVEQQGDGILGPFYIRDAKACHWSMEKNLAPKEYVDL